MKNKITENEELRNVLSDSLERAVMQHVASGGRLCDLDWFSYGKPTEKD